MKAKDVHYTGVKYFLHHTRKRSLNLLYMEMKMIHKHKRKCFNFCTYMQKAGDTCDISPQFFWIFRKILG